MIVLGIETTCDETAAAVVERSEQGRGKILSNIVLSQVSEHAAFGGVVPEIAARAHVEVLDHIIAKAMGEAKRGYDDLDGIAAAAGPGLIGGVIVGLTTAKAIALVKKKPLIAVNHLEAHALTARLTDATPFPYCLFLASGGHTQIVAVRGVGDYLRLGTTVDDAIGEAFDKTAKLLGLGYPGGPQVEKEAARGDAARFALPRPMHGRKEADFSLSGLKTALRLEAEKIAPLSDQDVADLCASFQQAVVDVVLDRLRAGLRIFRGKYGSPTALVAAGGVAANQAIRKVLHRLAFEVGTVLVAPPLELCTDNGAMIAWAGAERLALGLTDSLDVAPRARWPLDDVAQRAAGCGFAVYQKKLNSMTYRPYRRARWRRLGNGAGANLRARRTRCHVVGARARQCREPRKKTREPFPARSAPRRRHQGDARPWPSGTRRRHAAGGAGTGDALGLHGAGKIAARPHAADRLRQGHRARHAQVYDRDHRRMRAQGECRRSCRARASPPTWRADCRPR